MKLTAIYGSPYDVQAVTNVILSYEVSFHVDPGSIDDFRPFQIEFDLWSIDACKLNEVVRELQHLVEDNVTEHFYITVEHESIKKRFEIACFDIYIEEDSFASKEQIR